MKASLPRSVWIYLFSLLNTGYISIQSIFMSIIGRMNYKWADKVIRRWSTRILHLIDVKCTVVNPHKTEIDPKVPTIIMCNHSSLYDIPLTYYAFPKASIRMLAKKELFHIPLMGKGMIASGFPSIDRKNKQQAMKDLEVVKELLEKGIVVWIAPEGTRSKNGKINPFKKGGFITAINTKATIIPIGIRGASAILPAKTLRPAIGQETEVHIGKPINAAQYSLQNKDELIEKVYQSIKNLAGQS